MKMGLTDARGRGTNEEKGRLLLILLVGLGAAPVAAQIFDGYDNEKPWPAHKVIGNIYFVGNEGLGIFLITTPEGHILINSGYEWTVPVIRSSVE